MSMHIFSPFPHLLVLLWKRFRGEFSYSVLVDGVCACVLLGAWGNYPCTWDIAAAGLGQRRPLNFVRVVFYIFQY